MTAEWFDLGQRLHAAEAHAPILRLTHAPIVASPRPVAVRAHRSGHQITVSAASPTRPERTATGTEALALLDTLGVTMTAQTPATLITDTPTSLAALHQLARTAPTSGPHAAVAAHIAWWLDRADFPSGRAVVDTVAACRTRWVTGTTPTAETHPVTWRRWLCLPDDSTSALLSLHRRLTHGTPLRWLDALAEDDMYAFTRAREAFTEGMEWQRPESTARAANALRERCDAADLYAAAMLTDPLAHRRAVHTGHVATGTARVLTATGNPRKKADRLAVTCARLDVRLRPGNEVTGWEGPVEADRPTFTGQIVTSTTHQGHLVLTLMGISGFRPTSGQQVTLTPAPPDLIRQRSARKTYRTLYARRSWLTTGQRPTPARRPVPLDILVAGADQPETSQS